MKIIREPCDKKYKTVQYFDLSLKVPEETKYISVDASGEIILWMNVIKPFIEMFLYDDGEGWTGEVIEYYVGHVDLEGMDWKDTLKEV